MKIHPLPSIKSNPLYHIVFKGWSRDIEEYYLEFKSLYLFTKSDQLQIEINGKMVWVEVDRPIIQVHSDGTVKYNYSLMSKR